MPKPVISPTQAILILLKQNKDNDELSSKLKHWLLEGIPKKDHHEFTLLTQGPVLSHFEVTTDQNSINSDPVKRYFETHLAYRTLERHLSEISVQELEEHYQALQPLKPQDSDYPEDYRFIAFVTLINDQIDRILEGQAPEVDITKLFAAGLREHLDEYHQAISSVKQGKLFPHLSQEQRDKILLIVKCAETGVAAAMMRNQFASDKVHPLRLDIYDEGVFSTQERGKITKPEQETTRSQHEGLLWGHHPLMADDVAMATAPKDTVKASDKSTFKDSAWVRSNFELLTHPFSNSISGTMLTQLRALATLQHENQTDHSILSSKEKFNSFLTLFVAARLFGGGGHSLREYTEPLKIPQVVAEFPKLLSAEHPMTISSMFHDDHGAFDKALDEAIQYNTALLARQTFREELTRSKATDVTSSTSELNLTQGYKSQLRITPSPSPLQEEDGYLVPVAAPKQ